MEGGGSNAKIHYSNISQLDYLCGNETELVDAL